MADALPNVLEAASNSYSVFEANQVLASDQLNSLAAYLTVQEHLTRTRLLGVGIMGGFHVALSDGAIRVSQGAGITTDGDLLSFGVTKVFDRFKEYGRSAPRYAPFYVGEEMRSVFELVPPSQADSSAQTLDVFPGDLSEMVVVLLMERYEDDPDLCTGADCDNLGKTAIDTARLLLVARNDAGALLTDLKTVREAALSLPAVDAARPTFSPSVVTTSDLSDAFRKACRTTHVALREGLQQLPSLLPEFTQRVFGSDPTHEWTSILIRQFKPYDDRDETGIQYYYDHLKDLVDTWNGLRELLTEDDRILCPDTKAFPRHLLLGGLTNPFELRTGWFPAPLTSGDRDLSEHAIFLARKLDTQIRRFSVPTDGSEIRITPSYNEAVCLEERAIPFYYPAAMSESWSYRRSRRRDTAGINGYHTSRPGVFGRQIGRFDFFRVEGHLGMTVTQAKEKIERVVAENNLPFVVRAVLLHNDRRKIVVRPEIRYGDLHRLHQLLRKELTLQLAETKTFNEKFKAQLADLEVTLRDDDIPFDLAGNLNLSGQIKDAADEAAPVLAQTRFVDYQVARDAQDWRGGFKTVVNVASSMKVTAGDVTRSNYVSAFDSLLTNNYPAWLEWLETLIKSKEDQEDDKLMFRSFCQHHPGLEHFGGVIRGGTLVLIYDDQGRVVADFALPYNWSESAESEPREPVRLPDPVYKPPRVIESSIKVIPPFASTLARRLVDFEAKLKGNLIKDQFDSQNKQLDYLKQIVQTLGTRAAATPGRVDPNRTIADPLLKSLVDELDYQQRIIEDLRNVVVDPATPVDLRKKIQTELERVELDLANSIKRGTTIIAESETRLEAGTDGSKAVLAISNSLEKVGGAKARDALRGVSDSARVPPQIKQVFALRGL